LGSGPVVLSPRYLLDHVYNIDTLIKSVPMVKKTYPTVKYLQLMKKPEDPKVYEDYVRLVDSLGVRDNFIFVPVVENHEMPEFYSAADVCISIPNFDGFPVSVLEGSACGAPFIVSDVPFTREWFENGVSGIVLKELTPAGLAKETVALLGDEGLRESMGRLNRARVQEGFDYRRCMQRLEHLYESMIS
jgi:glycosyltransferase involved in cell wall biosynthesis